MFTRMTWNSPLTSPRWDDARSHRAHELDRKPDSLKRIRSAYDEAIDRWTNEGGALGANGGSRHSLRSFAVIGDNTP